MYLKRVLIARFLMCHGSFRVPAASLSLYVNNLLIEHDRGWRVARETRERSVCDTFLIAWQLLCLAPL